MTGPVRRTTRAKPADNKPTAAASTAIASMALKSTPGFQATPHAALSQNSADADRQGKSLDKSDDNSNVRSRQSRRLKRNDLLTEGNASVDTNKNHETTNLPVRQNSGRSENVSQKSADEMETALPVLAIARTTRSTAVKEKIKAFETTATEAAAASIQTKPSARMQVPAISFYSTAKAAESTTALSRAEQLKTATVTRLQQENQKNAQIPMTPSRRAAAASRRVGRTVRVFENSAAAEASASAGVRARLRATHKQSTMTPSLSAAHCARRVTGGATAISGIGQAVAAGRATRDGPSVKDWVKMIEVKSSFEGLKAPNDEEAVEIAAAEKFSGSDKITNIPQKQGGNEDQKDINVTNVQESTVLEFSKTGTSADTMTQEDATRSCDVRPKLPESMGTPVASLPKIFTFEFVQNPHQSSSSATFSAKAKTFMSPLRQSFTFDDSPGTSPSVSPSRFEKTGLLIQKALGSPVRLQKEMQVVNTSIMEEVPTGAAETPKKKITSKKRVPTPRSSKKKAELAVLIQTTEEPNPVTQHSAATEAKSDMGDEKKDEPEKSGLAPSKVYSVAMMPPNPNVNFTEAAQTPPPATTVTGKRNRGWGNGAAAVVQAYDDTPASTKRGISGKRKRVRVCAEEETEKEDDDGIFQDARMEISNCNVSPSQQRNYVSRGMDPQEWFETSDEDDGYDGKEERTAVGGGGDAGGSGWMFGLVKGIGRKIGMFG